MKIYAPLTNDLTHGTTPGLQEVEVATFLQIPGLQIIGLPGPEVTEARDRIRSAIESVQLELPRRRVVVNLSPAYLKKRGTGLDLAMALAILFEKKDTPPVAAWGELGLDGTVKPVGQMVRVLYAVWKKGIRYLMFAQGDFQAGLEALNQVREGECFQTDPPTLIPVENLREAWGWVYRDFADSEEEVKTQKFSQQKILKETLNSETKNGISGVLSEEPTDKRVGDDFSEDVHALLALPFDLERMLGVIASGAHHFLCLGPKGTGKSHSVEWLKAVLPAPTPKERLDHRLIAELGQFSRRNSLKNREKSLSPIRRVSTQVRPSALLKEYSLAHGGILIADEILEWSRDSRESLREPLERGWVTQTRAQGGSSELPARFLLAATGNFCPCGGWPPEIPNDSIAESEKIEGSHHLRLYCICPVRIRKRYLSKMNGPVLDRLDLVLIFYGTPALKGRVVGKNKNLKNAAELKSSSHLNPQIQVERLKNRIDESRQRMKSLWGMPPGLLSGADLEKILAAHPEWNEVLDEFAHASLRSRHKMLRVAMSLAVWDGLDQPKQEQFSEAFCYRSERIQLFH